MRQVIAEWRSKGGASYVILYRETDPDGIGYDASGGMGWMGNFASDTQAIAAMAPRVNDYQPDANRTPMRRVR
jgi:hypothetical protein